MDEKEKPNEQAIERMAQYDATPDRDDPNKFTNRNGRVVGYAEGGSVNIENGRWESA